MRPATTSSNIRTCAAKPSQPSHHSGADTLVVVVRAARAVRAVRVDSETTVRRGVIAVLVELVIVDLVVIAVIVVLNVRILSDVSAQQLCVLE
jgi:hypothetical protein